jgi:hypothetical protein
VVEVGLGSILLLADQSPTIAQGTWARLTSSTTSSPSTDGEQIRVFPLALHRLVEQVPGGPVGPVAIECETPLDPVLVARLSL